MEPLAKQPSTLITIAAVIVVALACAFLYLNRWQPIADHAEIASVPAGEPAAYAATVVRTVDDGESHEQFVTRIARSGEMRREEWSEQGKLWALIWRPDLGKYYLLDMDRREYVEASLNASAQSKPQPESSDALAGDRNGVSSESIDRAFTDNPSPLSSETILLPDQLIENYACQVTEQRKAFSDGHAEITRSFRARDLAGLVIKEEMRSTAGNTIIITERRNIRIEVSPEEFSVPAGFKKK